MHDLIIVGGGPAAIAAGIYAARKKLKTLLIAENWGGQMRLAPIVENYPGIEPALAGMELAEKMVTQLKKNELEIKEGEKVEKIEANGDRVKVATGSGSYEARALIVATGRNPKKLEVNGEKEYLGKGISYCTTCDGPLYKNKIVAIVGGGNSGAISVLEMIPYAAKIYWLVSTFRSDPFYIEKIKQSPKVEIIENSRIASIVADKFVTGLTWKDKNTSKENEIKLDGIFVAVGSEPNSGLVKNVVELDELNQIKVDSDNITSVPNIFAAGDATSVPYKQLAVAVGEGTKACLSVYEYLLTKD